MDQTTPKIESLNPKIRVEVAKRVLARRSLIAYTQRFLPKYKPGWVHYDIARRLEQFMRDVADEKSPRLMLLVPPRHGKLCIHTVPVLTQNRGWTTHGDLRVGDLVFHPSGQPTAVVALSPDALADYEVEFSNGDVITTHANHEWVVRDRRRGGEVWRTVETHELAADYWIGTKGERGGRARWQVQDVQGVEFPKRKDLPLDPYVLGVWLGDGTTGKPCITNSPEDGAVFREAFEAAGYACSRCFVHPDYGTHAHYFGHSGLTQDLQAVGVFSEKHVPEAYLRASRAQRMELLAGLIDTDGHVEQDTGRVRFVTTSPALRDAVLDLATTLGFRPYLTEVPATLSSSGVQGRHSVSTVGFQPHTPLPLRLSRKRTVTTAVRRRVSVTSVRRTAPQPGRCIQVASPDGLYLVGRTLVPTHNSELGSIRFPGWCLGHHPEWEIINCGYNLDLPMRFSRRVRENLRDPGYTPLFPDSKLDPDSQSVESWNTTAGGGFTAAGVGGGITGKGAHILLIDDPIKNQDEADSANVRDGLWDWYWSTAYSRLAPGGGVLLIETWWSDDDLAGRLQQKMEADPFADQFIVVRYPAQAEKWEYRNKESDLIERFDAPLDPKHIQLRMEQRERGVSVPVLVDDTYDLLRMPGEALHPERYNERMIDALKANQPPRIWSALYQQNPAPDEGLYFRESYIKVTPNIPQLYNINVYQAWDFAIGEKQQNDWTVGVTLLQDENDYLYVVELVRFKGDSFTIVEEMLDAAQRWGSEPTAPLTLGVEDSQIWKAIKPLFERRMAERAAYAPYETLKPLTDKMARARPLQGRMQQGRVYFPKDAAWLPEVKKELLRFPAGQHDDIVDALAWCVHLTLGKSPRLSKRAKPPESWRDKLKIFSAGGSSHMSA